MSILVLLASCKKKEDDIDFDFEVSVYDYHASIPIYGVNVNSYTKGVNGGTYTNSYQLQASESTDSEGICEFNIPYSGIETIKLTLEKEGYFNQNLEYNPDDFSTDELNELDIPLKKKSFIYIQIKNAAPSNAFDQIVFNSTNADCNECVKFNDLELVGTNADTLISGTVVGNRYYTYQYIVTKNGVSTNYNGSIFCDQDTNQLVVSY